MPCRASMLELRAVSQKPHLHNEPQAAGQSPLGHVQGQRLALNHHRLTRRRPTAVQRSRHPGCACSRRIH
jgi:hypothetical protein